MANNKKVVQRGCAKRSSNNITSRQRRKTRSRSVKQRGGDLHKMYNYNSLQVDPQRMITMDKGTVQTGGKGTETLYKGKGGKHRHSRKYYKRGGALNYSALENAVHQATTAPMFNTASIQTNTQVPAYV